MVTWGSHVSHVVLWSANFLFTHTRALAQPFIHALCNMVSVHVLPRVVSGGLASTSGRSPCRSTSQQPGRRPPGTHQRAYTHDTAKRSMPRAHGASSRHSPAITACPAAKQDAQPLFSDEFWERIQNTTTKVTTHSRCIHMLHTRLTAPRRSQRGAHRPTTTTRGVV